MIFLVLLLFDALQYIMIFYILITLLLEGMQSILMSICVFLSVHWHINKRA